MTGAWATHIVPLDALARVRVPVPVALTVSIVSLPSALPLFENTHNGRLHVVVGIRKHRRNDDFAADGCSESPRVRCPCQDGDDEEGCAHGGARRGEG